MKKTTGEALFDVLSTVLQNVVAPLFKPEADMKLTLICRSPHNPELDVLISSDTPEGIEEAVARSKTRPIEHDKLVGGA